MKKYIAVICVLLLVLPFVGCKMQVVLDEMRIYPIETDIQSLKIRINAADFTIKQAEGFAVESNLKHLSVSEKDGVLSVIDEAKHSSTYTGAKLLLYMPAGVVLDRVNITTGAAKLTAEALSARSLKLQLGAGDVKIDSLNAISKADIEGGAGKITIAGGTLNNLELEMGIGELNLTAALTGNSDLAFGVGESNLTLIGDREDYSINIEKGIGNMTVDGKTVSDFGSSGNGQNYVQMEGGVGAIHLRFQ